MVPDKYLGELGTIVSTRPWEVVGSDMLGPLPVTPQGYRYILTFTDHFTKWVEAFPIKTATAGEVAQHFVESIICKFGAPDCLLMDRGKAFIGELMEEVNKFLEVRMLRTSGYHPQTNGLTERFNKTLMSMLSMYTGAHQRDWDQYIPYVLHAYRTSVHDSTGETPFFLNHGFDPKMPSVLNEFRIDEQWESVGDYRTHLTDNLRKIWEEV
jgi:transposase InsO family protein